MLGIGRDNNGVEASSPTQLPNISLVNGCATLPDGSGVLVTDQDLLAAATADGKVSARFQGLVVLGTTNGIEHFGARVASSEGMGVGSAVKVSACLPSGK